MRGTRRNTEGTDGKVSMSAGAYVHGADFTGSSSEPSPSKMNSQPQESPDGEDLTSPKRKRGRPKKNQADDEQSVLDIEDLTSPPQIEPRKRGRPRKNQGSDETTVEEETIGLIMTVEGSSTYDAKLTEQGKGQPSSTIIPRRQKSGQMCADALDRRGNSLVDPRGKDQSEVIGSPRRSSRSVVPNRRFQDMELDFGRKRIKEEPESPDSTPVNKRAKKSASSKRKRQSKAEMVEEEVGDLHQTESLDGTVSTGEDAKKVASNVNQNTTADFQDAGASKHQSVSTSASSSSSLTAAEELESFRPAVKITVSQAETAGSNNTVSQAETAGSKVFQPTSVTDSSATSHKANRKQVQGTLSEKGSPEQAFQGTETNVEGAAVSKGAHKVITVTASAPAEGIHTGTSKVSPSHLTVVASGKGKVMAVQSPHIVMTKPVSIMNPGKVAGGADVHRKIVIQHPPRSSTVASSDTARLSVTTESELKSTHTSRTSAIPSTERLSAGDVSPNKVVPPSSVHITSLVEVSPNKTVPVVIGERRENAAVNVKVVTAQPPQQQSLGFTPSHAAQQTATKTQPSALSSSSLEFEISTSQSSEDLPVSSQDSSTLEEFSSVPASPLRSQGQTVLSCGKDPTVSVPQLGQVVVVVPKPSTGGLGSPVGTDKQLDKGTGDRSSGQKTQETSVNTSDLDSSQDSDMDSVDSRNSKFATSGTQTPYHKKVASSDGRKLITVLVQPPLELGQQASGTTQRGTVAVVKTESMDGADDITDADEMEEMERESRSYGIKGTFGSRQQFIMVNVPEGSTVKNHYIKSKDLLDDDPTFYTLDEQGMYHCHVCDYKTDRKPNFYKHKKKHLGIRPHRCEICNYRAATSSNLKRHLAIHADLRNYRCHICNLNFRQKIHLERHVKYKHEEKKVKCPLCDYVCANENPDLKVHIRRKHVPHSGDGDKEAFTCRECGMVAMSKRDLRQHIKFHSKGPELKLFCQMCSFVTDCESRLRRHQYIHSKEKPFQCGLCDYRGSQKEHVLRHMRSQHNIEIIRKQRTRKDSPSMTKSPAGAGDEAPTSGPASPRVMERADYTSEEKIFACNHCTMKFAKLINLYKHLHTQHRDIMPSDQGDFACVVCDFHTTNKKNLLVHMRKHNMTDQCPPSHVYSCVLCRYMNPKRRNLFQHMRKKHHIEIVLRDDGSTTCYVANDAMTLPGSSGGHMPSGSEANIAINVMSLSDVMTTVAQPLPSEIQVSRQDGTITVTSGGSIMPTMMKMEDLAMVVTNPNSSVGSDSCVVVDGSGSGEGVSVGALSQSDAAEAIQGLQALAQRGVLDSSTVVEEQVQVMAADEQATLVIDPTTMGVVEQLVQPKTEPLEVVEIDESQLLDDVNSTPATISEEDAVLLDGAAPVGLLADIGGLQLSAEQLMNLATGDYIEINGEMFKVDVSNSDAAGGQQVISIEPVSAAEQSRLQAHKDMQLPDESA